MADPTSTSPSQDPDPSWQGDIPCFSPQELQAIREQHDQAIRSFQNAPKPSRP